MTSVQTTSDADYAGVRGARAWWAVLLLAVLLSAAGVAGSGGWAAGGHEGLGPPYEVPAIAEVLLDAEELSEVVGSPLVLLTEGPPQNKMFLSGSALVADVRGFLVDQGWTRTWTSADASIEVSIDLVNYRDARSAQGQRKDCAGLQPVPEDLPDAVSGIASTSRTTRVSCTEGTVGRSLLVVELTLYERPQEASQLTWTQAIFRAQAAALDAADLGLPRPESAPLSWSQAEQWRAWMVALLVLATIAVVPVYLTDRATYERIGSYFTGYVRREGQVDVDRDAANQLVRVRALGWVRFATLVWALRLAEELNLDGLASLVAMGIALFAGLVLESMVTMRAAPPPRSILTVRARAIVLAGGALSALVIASAVGVWVSGVSLGSAGVLAAEVPEWYTTQAGVSFQVISALMLLWSYAPITVARRLAMRHLRDSPVGSDGDFLLYLRSFADDAVKMRTRFAGRRVLVDRLALRRRERFEQVQVVEFHSEGSVVGVGTPGERLPPELGAVRIQMSHDAWQGRVSELTEGAKHIVLTLGRTEGLVWEVRRIRDLGLLHKTIVLVPPLGRTERRRRLAVLANELGVPWSLFEAGRGRCVVVVYFPLGDMLPTSVVARAPDDVAYAAAIAHVLREQRAPINLDAVVDLSDSTDRDVRDDDDTPRPPAEILPAGTKAKTFSVLRSPWVWSSVLSVLAGTLVPWMVGDPLVGESQSTPWPFEERITALPGAEGDSFWLVSEMGPLGTFTMAGEVGVAFDPGVEVDEALLHDGRLFVLSRASGLVTAFDADDLGDPLWQVELERGVRGLSVDGDRLAVAQPVSGAVTLIRTEDGSIVGTRDIGGWVWDALLVGDELMVVTLDTSEFVLLDVNDLSVLGRVATVRAPVALDQWLGGLVVQSWADHLVFWTRGEETLTLSTPTNSPTLAASSEVLAVEGWERVTVIDSTGTLSRIGLFSGAGVPMMVQGSTVTLFDGDVVRQFEART